MTLQRQVSEIVPTHQTARERDEQRYQLMTLIPANPSAIQT